MQRLHIALARGIQGLLYQGYNTLQITMAPLKELQKTTQSVTGDLPSAHTALENREDFSLWAEAVKQQMLEALQKRQRNN
jgi:hypothetical protein